MSSTTASKECGRQRCRGTAFWDIACKCYVCETCMHHNGKSRCGKCGYDSENEAFRIEEED